MEELCDLAGGGVQGVVSQGQAGPGSAKQPDQPPAFNTLGMRLPSRGGQSDGERLASGPVLFGEAFQQDGTSRSRGSSASSSISMYDLAQRLRGNSLDAADEGGLTPMSVAAENASLEILVTEGNPVRNAKFTRRRRKSILGRQQEDALRGAGHSPYAFEALVDERGESMFGSDF